MRQIAELREDQIAHEKLARAKSASNPLPLNVSELSRHTRANLNKAAAGRPQLPGDSRKSSRAWISWRRQLAADKDAMAGTLSDAVELSRQRAIGSTLQQTASDLGENRVSQASNANGKSLTTFSNC
jgi:hypothetical protein